MQPRLNIAIKACRAASEIINKIYKSKDQDDLRSYDDITTVLFKHIVESINETKPIFEKASNRIGCPTFSIVLLVLLDWSVFRGF